MIRNLSLTFEDFVESAAKAIAAPQKFLNSLATAVLANRLALDYLLAEQGGACAMANTTCWNWINTSGEIETQLHKITEQGTWLKKLTPFFDLFDSDWFGSRGTRLWSARQTLRIILLIIIIVVPLVYCILSEALNSGLQLPVTKQMISLRLECQKRNEENDHPKEWRNEENDWSCDLWIPQRSSKKMSWPVNTTQRVRKNCENSREVAGSSANGLNFDSISVRLRAWPKGGYC